VSACELLLCGFSTARQRGLVPEGVKEIAEQCEEWLLVLDHEHSDRHVKMIACWRRPAARMNVGGSGPVLGSCSTVAQSREAGTTV
jgi:hypothetical protein